jgi:hypothetical protein
MKQQKSNSISFGPVNFDQGKHLLQAKGKLGKNQITCSITEQALKEVYQVQGGEREYVKSFEDHKPQIEKAVMQKIKQQEWKVKDSEVQIDEKDLRRFS